MTDELNLPMPPDRADHYWFFCWNCEGILQYIPESLPLNPSKQYYVLNCPECKYPHPLGPEERAEDKEMAYLNAVGTLRAVANGLRQQNHGIGKEYEKLVAKNHDLQKENRIKNTVVFVVEKGFRDIVKMIEEKKYDDAIAEAKDGIAYVIKEQENVQVSKKKEQIKNGSKPRD